MAEATQKAANYTAEMVDSMIEMYNEVGNDGLDDIADTLGKTVRSVRSKLVREGVYVASPQKDCCKARWSIQEGNLAGYRSSPRTSM